MIEFFQAVWDGGGAFFIGLFIAALGSYLLFYEPNEEEFLPIGHEWLAMAYLKLGGGDPAQAKTIFTLENDPDQTLRETRKKKAIWGVMLFVVGGVFQMIGLSKLA